MNDKIQRFLWRTFLSVFSINMIFVLVLSIIKTENHLPASKMIMLPILFVCVLLGGLLILHKFERLISQISPVVFPIFLLGYGIVLYFLAINGRSAPVHDQEAVYQGALYFAGLSEEISWEYFARWNNNIAPAFLLGIVFRIGSFGGLVDPYYFAVFLNVVQVLAALYCIFTLVKERNKITGAWCAVIMMAMCIPIVGHTLALYTDSMSFCFGIVAFYLWKRNQAAACKVKYWLVNILIGIMLGIAALIKMTVLITAVAILIYSVLEANKKVLGKSVAVLAVSITVLMIGNHLTTLLPCEGMRDSYGTPKISYFIGIGIKGNGGYVDNQEYLTQLNTIYGMEEKESWSNQYIKENLYEFWNKDHIIQKLRYNFANGGFGCTILTENLHSEHILYRLMHYDGDLYWRYSMLTTAYIYAVYGFIIVGMILQVVRKEKADEAFGVALVTIFGIMLYLMLFEANNRQLYNHLPWFILAASCGLSDIGNTIIKRMKNYVNHIV